jgi:ABC-type Mn2+/Zn2+ transport system permease subunit
MDTQALITALFGVAIGAIGCYLLVRRDWWLASSFLAIGAAALLNMITEGPHSRGEDLVKFAATACLMVISVVAGVVHQRRHRTKARNASTLRPISPDH